MLLITCLIVKTLKSIETTPVERQQQEVKFQALMKS